MEVVGAVIEGEIRYIDEIQRSLGPPRLRQGCQGCSTPPVAPGSATRGPDRALVAGRLPVGSPPHRHVQRHLQLRCRTHLRTDQILDLGRFAGRHLQD